MDPLQKGDVPYGNDWDRAAEAAAWADAADATACSRCRPSTSSVTGGTRNGRIELAIDTLVLYSGVKVA